MKKRILLLLLLLAVLAVSIGWDFPTDTQDTAHEIAELARSLGLPEDDPIIVRAQELWWDAYDDLRILANVIHHEAPYCSDRHQQLVAQVIVNRREDPDFPDTIREIVTAPGQYDPSYVKNLPVESTSDPELQRCFDNARAALLGLVDCPANVVYQSEFKSLGTGVYEEITVDTGWFRSTTYFNYG